MARSPPLTATYIRSPPRGWTGAAGDAVAGGESVSKPRGTAPVGAEGCRLGQVQQVADSIPGRSRRGRGSPAGRIRRSAVAERSGSRAGRSEAGDGLEGLPGADGEIRIVRGGERRADVKGDPIADRLAVGATGKMQASSWIGQDQKRGAAQWTKVPEALPPGRGGSCRGGPSPRGFRGRRGRTGRALR